MSTWSIYSPRWEAVDPARVRFDAADAEETVRRTVLDLLGRAQPLGVLREMFVPDLDAALVAGQGEWAQGWSFSKGEGSDRLG
ncbi:MAG: hypothetical protein QM767_00585 [Anaeromyxobacter sp.]